MLEKILAKIGRYSELWGHNEQQTRKSVDLDKIQAQILKSSLGLHHYTTATQWVLWETNTMPTAIAIDAEKIRAWRAWVVKEDKRGVNIPPYIRRVTRDALTRMGNRKTKWIDAKLTGFPSKTRWNTMAKEWAREAATEAFHHWWENLEQDDSITNGADMAELKPEWGNTSKLIGQVRKWLGKSTTTYLRARANTLGLKYDASKRNIQHNAPHKQNCRGCNKGGKETLAHILLECEGYRNHRKPLTEAIENLSAKDKQEWIENTPTKEDTLQIILEATYKKITKTAMDSLKNIMQEIEL